MKKIQNIREEVQSLYDTSEPAVYRWRPNPLLSP